MAETLDDGRLLAWLDGELPPGEAARVAAAVAADPELAALAEAHRALAARLRGGLDAVLAEPVPARLMAAVAQPMASVTDLAAVRAARAASPPPPRRWWPQVTALAASLALGLFVGRTSLQAPGLMVSGPGGMQASGVLAVALNDQLAGAPVAGPVRVAISFRDRQGRLCRSWQAQAQEGIACRAGDGWAVTAALARTAEPGGDYRMAAGSPVAGLVDSMIAGEPLDAAQERAAQARGWR